jgi:uncharacterized protein DUF4376
MSIVQIANNEVVTAMPINQPIDDTWRYVFDPFPDIDTRYQYCSGYTYAYNANTDTVTATAVTAYLSLDDIKNVVFTDLASLRWDIQNGGTIMNGIPVPTDSDTQRNILGARLEVVIDPTYSVNWKTPIGFMTLDANTIGAMSEAIRTHIQLCFDNEAAHITSINALNTPQEVITYDFTTGWPT